MENLILPDTVVPSRYEVFLKTWLSEWRYEGVAHSIVDVKAEVDAIVCNAHELKIVDASIKPVKGDDIVRISNIEYDKELQRATLSLPKSIAPGKYEINFRFEKEIVSGMFGFYRAPYTDKEGIERRIALTQCEPTYCRCIFPCWDEPARKAVFSLTIIHEDKYKAVSNTEVVSDEAEPGEPGWRKVKFADTPLMSSYLFALVIGEMEYLEDKNVDGVRCRVYSQLGNLDKYRYALEVTKSVLHFFHEFFEIPYALNKVDMLAVPNFAAGAMENWGCITFRETRLLYDEKMSTIQTKMGVAYVIAHELAHMWFGNLVTMKFWEDLWLNEGFATWAGNLAVHRLNPSWDVWTHYIRDYTSGALGLDALLSTHPIHVPIKKVADIEDIFDVISYQKGSAMLLMLAEYLGVEAFRVGLHKYLNKFKFGNAETADLFSVLGESTGAPVADVMGNWISKPGYPLLRVSLVSEDEAAGKAILRFSQSRFHSNGEEVVEGTIWQIPLGVSVSGKPVNHVLLMKEKVMELEVNVDFSREGWWVLVNTGASGFFRVEYDSQLLLRLRTADLSPGERYLTLSDVFALSRFKEGKTIEALELVRSTVPKEDNNIVLAACTSYLRLVRWLVTKSKRGMVDNLIVSLLEPLALKYGWDKPEGEAPGVSMNRQLTLEVATMCGSPTLVEEAKELFYKCTKGEKELSPDIAGIVYGAAVRYGGIEEFKAVLDEHNNATIDEIRIRMVGALSKTTELDRLVELIELGISSEKTQDLVYYIVYICYNEASGDLPRRFLMDNYNRLSEKCGGLFLMGRIVSEVIRSTTNREVLSELEEFLKGKTAGFEMKVEQALEATRNFISWMELERERVEEWLDNLS